MARPDDDRPERRRRRGVPRSDEPVELSPTVDAETADPDLGDGDLDDLDEHPDLDLRPSDVDFEELYAPDVLAAIEAGPTRSSEADEPGFRVSQWRRRSALGAVLTGMALGLQEVFDPEEERSIVIEVDEDGLPVELPVQMFLDPDSPAGSLCIVARPDAPPPVV